MWAGTLNEVIEIYRYDKLPNEYGETVVVKTKVRDCRAKVHRREIRAQINELEENLND